mmetsp:Transcript_31744/g.58171  ORF Transcript_31744/g.58171 Transcript_31744/m.58171 type:complete len:153 (-) Transcript_31744:871-1329(-)
MKVGASSTDVQAVKNAFETVYADIGISCAEVGGLWSHSDDNYYTGMDPCIEIDQLASSQPSGNPTTSQSVLTTTGGPYNSAITEASTNSSPAIVDGDMSTMTSRPSTSTIAENVSVQFQLYGIRWSCNDAMVHVFVLSLCDFVLTSCPTAHC